MSTEPPPGTGEPEPPRRESTRPQIVVVDFGKGQTRKKIKRLRKGRGKLMSRVERIVDELIEGGTVKGDVQPVVIVVRERTSTAWPFYAASC